MRLDRFITLTTELSRKEAKEKLKSGCFFVGNLQVKDPAINIDEYKDEVFFNGKKLYYEKYSYYMLNKPAGYVSATVDSAPTVIDLLKKEGRKDLFPIGRLDKDTVGLLLITNDGELSHHLTSPRHHVPKCYFVKTLNVLSKDDLKKLENGILLKDDGMTKPALTEYVSDTEIYLTITEGMYHQVKRMIASLGNEVTYLKRVSIGDLVLDTSLKEGEYRRLNEEEIALLRK